MAVYHTELSRKSPGLLLADIHGGDPQVKAVADVVSAVSPDVLLLLDVDYDLYGLTAKALAVALGDYPFHFAPRPNRGRDTGRDIDGDGRLGEPEDQVGYADFSGQSGMVVLSRFEILGDHARDFSDFEWGALPGTLATEADTNARLSTTSHLDIPVHLPDGTMLHVLAWHATPPVFDGPGDRNGRRNHDEAAFWSAYLDGALPFAPPTHFVLMGGANMDVSDGDGRPDAMRALLRHAKVGDFHPESAGGVEASHLDGAQNDGHSGHATHDTADWPETGGYPGNLRVDYLIPSRSLRVTRGEVFWPVRADPFAETVSIASRHRLIWADITLSD